MKAWFRIDNRLIHGQVIEAWVPYLDAAELVVVNDGLARDELQQQIMKLAVPGKIMVTFSTVSEARGHHDRLEAGVASVLFLFASCEDAAAVVRQGVRIPTLNVGNMHYAEGKRQICQHVAASREDMHCLKQLEGQGTKLDYRSVPGDVPVVEEWKCP